MGTAYSRLAVSEIDVCVFVCVKASVCEQALINIPFARPPVQTVRHRKQK